MTSSAVASVGAQKATVISASFHGVNDPKKAVQFIRELVEAEEEVQARKRDLIEALKGHYNLSVTDEGVLFRQLFSGASTPDCYLVRLLERRRKTR